MATKKQLEPVAPAADKKKALAAALSQIEKQFGKGSVMCLGENTGMTVEHIPTGSIGLDLALGIGGLPRGRIIEIYGPESSGKTTVALHSVAEAQKLGGTAAFIDAEHALDPVYAKALGVEEDIAATCTSVTLVFLGVLLTGLRVYDNIAKFAGAGTLVPITGFANSVASPALEFKSEGFITGMAAKMFVIAGPVIVYGISSSVVCGIILYLFGMV